MCKKGVAEAGWDLGSAPVKLFGYWRYQPAVAFLAEQAENTHADIRVRMECVQSLGMFENGRTTSELTKVMTTKGVDSRLVKAAADMLATGGVPGFRALGNVLNNPSATIESRTVAAEALGRSGTKQAAQLLQQQMGNGNLPEQLRADCAFNLGATGEESAISVLVKTMKTTNVPAMIQNACLHGLAASKRREVVPDIIDAILSDADNRQYRRDEASQLLRSLRGMDLGRDKEKWHQWYELQKDKPWKSGL